LGQLGDVIEMYLIEMYWKGMFWSDLAANMDRWQAVMNIAMN
jgi:hypothetical protein